MSSNYGYKPSVARTFNQLVQQGLSAEDAATQTGVSNNPGAYGYGTNSNLGSIIPGAGGTIGGVTDAPELTSVPYPQSSTGEPDQQPAQTTAPAPSTFQDPTQRAVTAVVVPLAQQAAEPTPSASPITESQLDSRIISSTPSASSGFGYGTGINTSSVALTTAADTVNANTSGLPIQNEQGDVVAGILQNPETGETYYTDATGGGQAAQPLSINAPADVEPSDAGASVGSINSVQDPQQAAEAAANAQAVVGTQLAQRQAVLEAQRKLVNNGDWRVRLSLAKNAQYLYNDPNNPGILKPLAATGGVIFPYLPKIETTYTASYDEASLTHSNNKNYFYRSSSVGAIGLTATFTAQDSVEADYLLAVIHFFRSVTKMFYGQDAQRGAPPPLVYLTGLGEFQFSGHPCVVTSFTYSLPNDVDYIRARSPNVNGTSLLTRRSRQNLPTDPISGAIKRLSNLFTSQGINKGAQQDPPAPPTLGKNSPTYVPTRMDITLSLLPVQTRAQVSQVFSLKSFANGDLIKGGFW